MRTVEKIVDINIYFLTVKSGTITGLDDKSKFQYIYAHFYVTFIFIHHDAFVEHHLAVRTLCSYKRLCTTGIVLN